MQQAKASRASFRLRGRLHFKLSGSIIMSTMNKFGAVFGLFAALLLGACESTGYRTDTAYSGYGVVQSIELVKQDGIGGSGIGVGTIAGGVVGGVLGSQVGSGSGQTAATIGGAAAGAYVGHQLEKRQQGTGDVYKFTVRMEWFLSNLDAKHNG